MLTVLMIGLFVVLFLVALPFTRLRRGMLRLFSVLVQTATLAVVVAAGVFTFVPNWATPFIESGEALTTSMSQPVPEAWVWPAVGIVAVVIGLPLVLLVEFAGNLTRYQAAIGSLTRRLKAAAQDVSKVHVAMHDGEHKLGDEVAYGELRRALRVIGELSDQANRSRDRGKQRVGDLLRNEVATR